jgi:hypothetical protein
VDEGGEVVEEEPSVAKAIIEGYQIADPNARQDPAVVEALNKISASVDYQRQLTQVLSVGAGPSADGVRDWRVLDAGASAWFDAPSMTPGAALVRRIAELTAATGLPYADLRPGGGARADRPGGRSHPGRRGACAFDLGGSPGPGHGRGSGRAPGR